MQGGDDNIDRYDASYRRDQKRFAAQGNAKRFKKSQADIIRSRSVLMERAVHIEDLKHLKFEGRSLYEVLITERGWTGILEIKGKVYSDIVYDFYKPLKESSRLSGRLSAHVRRVKVVITPKDIASFLHLPRQHQNPRSSQQPVDEIHQALTGNEHARYDVNEVISLKDLLPFFQMLHLIIAANIKPTKHTTDISIEKGRFLLDIARGVDIDLPYLIFKTIESAADSGSSEDGLPFGLLITGLSLKAGVQPQFGEKEDEPMDLIRMIKPSQTGPLPCPSTTEAVGTASSSQTLPPWFHAMLLEVRSQIAAEVAPIQRQLTGIDSRLKTVEDRVQELHRPWYN